MLDGVCVNVRVGNGVRVKVAEAVNVGVLLGVNVNVRVGNGVRVEVAEAVNVGEGVTDGVGV